MDIHLILADRLCRETERLYPTGLLLRDPPCLLITAAEAAELARTILPAPPIAELRFIGVRLQIVDP